MTSPTRSLFGSLIRSLFSSYRYFHRCAPPNCSWAILTENHFSGPYIHAWTLLTSVSTSSWSSTIIFPSSTWAASSVLFLSPAGIITSSTSATMNCALRSFCIPNKSDIGATASNLPRLMILMRSSPIPFSIMNRLTVSPRFFPSLRLNSSDPRTSQLPVIKISAPGLRSNDLIALCRIGKWSSRRSALL